MSDAPRQSPAGSPVVPERRPWSLPTLRELPKLTQLTLTSAVGGGGGTGGGGSTVFGLLLAAGLAFLSACSADQPMEPTAPAMPKAVASVSCVGDVATGTVTCAAPQKSPGRAILGGQGIEVALRSSNVQYDNGTGDFTFDVTVQNLSRQPIGYNGAASTGIRVFFSSGPTVTGGTGAITVLDDSIGTFTGSGQDYYVWPGISLDQGNTSAPLGWRFHVPGTVNTFSFSVQVAADVPDRGGVYRWTPMTGFDQTAYNDIAASSPTDWMAVGNNGATSRWNGTVWKSYAATVSENINSVVAIAPGEYIAATGGGAVLHFKNDVWTEMYRRGDFGTFYAVWAKDTTHIVAVGSAGITSHFTGGSWTDEDVPTLNGGDLIAVSGNSNGSRVSALNGGFLSTEVWTSTSGGALTVDPTFFSIFGVATDIAYDAAGDALVAYDDVGGVNGFILRSNSDTLVYAGNWFPLGLIPHGTDEVAVSYRDMNSGDYGVLNADYSALPASITLVSTTLGGGYDIGQITATNAAADQFAVVSNGNEHLLTSDGTTWIDPQGAGQFVDPDLWGVGDTLWALDGSAAGNFYRIENGVAINEPGFADLIRFWGSSSTSFFGVSTYAVFASNGTGGWSNIHITGGGTYSDVWADPTGNAVIAIGTNGPSGITDSRVLGSWGSTQFFPGTPEAVWGCDQHTAWIVTAQGVIWKWTDGSVAPDFAVPGGPFLRGITGSSCSDVWVIGDGLERAHWDGTTWTDLGAPISGIFSAITMGSAAGEYYFGGYDGSATVATSTGYYNLYPPTQGREIHSMWRLDNGEVYAAGPQLFLRGQR